MTFDAADSPTALPLAQVTPDRFDAGEATPAAVLSGEVPASQAAHPVGFRHVPHRYRPVVVTHGWSDARRSCVYRRVGVVARQR